MKRSLLIVALFLVTFPLLADDTCSAYMRLGALYEVRGLMMKPYASTYDVDTAIDRRLERLREGWTIWARPDKDAPRDKHTHVVAAANGASSDSFEVSGSHVFEVKVVVPSKRSLFNKNAPVYVGTLRVNYEIDGKSRTKSEAINAWMNPDTTRTLYIDGIADRANAAVDVSTNQKDTNQSVVEIHFVQAVPRDDPSNPAYDTIQSLQRIRSTTDAFTIDDEIARAERQLFPESESIPLLSIIGDLHRAAEMMHSKKEGDYDKGERLLKETMRRLR